MVVVKCQTSGKLRLRDMKPFYGGFKAVTDGQLADMKRSLLLEGLLSPFLVWRGLDEDGLECNCILDGHVRRQALSLMADEGDNEIMEMEFPVVYIDAENSDEAKKALLQISSSYGKVVRKGAREFCASISEYRAPVTAFLFKPVAPIRDRTVPLFERPAEDALKAVSDESVVMNIAVPAEYESAVRELLGSMSYTRVL